MIVVDTSVFLDELFKFNQKRHDKARILFRLIEEKDVMPEKLLLRWHWKSNRKGSI